MRKLIILILIIPSFALAQFDGPGGTSGSKSIHKDDASISGWAASVVVERGYVDIADTAQGFVTHGVDSNALSASDGMVVSLGDGGRATLEFDEAIINKPGYDFAVFENGFLVGLSYYLELAFVEVSKDGNSYYRFPSRVNMDSTFQTDNFFYTKPSEVHLLAGKHQAPYGTLFDLDSVPIDTVNYVRIVDVVGSINDSFGSRDSRGRIINEPYPSPFASGGFDLDAVAVLNGYVLSTPIWSQKGVKLYPNPGRVNEEIRVDDFNGEITVINSLGQMVLETNRNHFNIIKPGVYMVYLKSGANIKIERICVN